MSNCIRIVADSPLIFTDGEFDIPRFKEELKKSKHFICGLPSERPTKEELEANLIWWFLDGNVEFTEDRVAIFLGKGRSSHTQRDFKAVILYLTKFLKRTVQVFFYIQDGFGTTWKLSAVLTPNCQSIAWREQKIA